MILPKPLINLKQKKTESSVSGNDEKGGLGPNRPLRTTRKVRFSVDKLFDIIIMLLR